MSPTASNTARQAIRARIESIRADEDKRIDKKFDRRTFVKRGLIAGGALAGGGLVATGCGDEHHGSSTRRAPSQPAPRVPPTTTAAARRPNILVIVVDQLRFPQWFRTGAPGAPSLPPNLRLLRHGVGPFARHYTASNDCTPARSALLTGLYTHQTGCMITGGSTLDPGFPTWGTLLREHGYHTSWYGKWHLTHHDNKWNALDGPRALADYGFAGGTYPSPAGAPGQGTESTRRSPAQFEEWFATERGREPMVHDRLVRQPARYRVVVQVEQPGPGGGVSHRVSGTRCLSTSRPPSSTRSATSQGCSARFRTPRRLVRAGPLQRPGVHSHVAGVPGPLPASCSTRSTARSAASCARSSSPAVAANTVILFTSDHGEYGASHGLRGKGAGAYEEGIRVPLFVKDPRGVLTRAPGRIRDQLTSSVDVAPLLLTIASGSDDWRRERAATPTSPAGSISPGSLADPDAPGRAVCCTRPTSRDRVRHRTVRADAPLHVVALRTPRAQVRGLLQLDRRRARRERGGQENELYDYRTHEGRLELDNVAGRSPLEERMHAEYERAFYDELRAPLPPHLGGAHARGFADYFSTARHAAIGAAARRKRRLELEVGPLGQYVGGTRAPLKPKLTP